MFYHDRDQNVFRAFVFESLVRSLVVLVLVQLFGFCFAGMS